ncbi:DUF2867 domain-containing protein [Labilibaculum sp. K2S]|uniref:DUF2867 domain-containing protein n=1 Tax=Labilibaculum sp. K2S TaxID=3056386 RepID=UPI0025A3C93C|nr:DUF2867 domain-containing protein [Labilibaculum sp. K2S]MDM8161776.1 DUF2867 domain-containing protein [Labilibaculum sp. K2S]
MIKKQTKIPDQSILNENKILFHYIDSFQSDFMNQGLDYDIISIGKLFFTSSPKWADNLMSLRDKIVGMFGLKTTSQLTAEQRDTDSFKFEPGEQLDIFKLYIRTENELIMGEDDKHLSFRFSLLLDNINDGTIKQRITLTTGVEFKNLFGRLYFFPVKPFHQLIVKRTLKRMIQKIEKEND